jgi:chemotaxis protein histidine kinase CheA
MSDELRELQRDYLADVLLTINILREHGRDLGAASGFKSSFPALLFLTHQLKGSGGSLGFPKITEVARRISEQLNLFLDDERVTRPTPVELSETLLTLSGELEREVSSAQQRLQ